MHIDERREFKDIQEFIELLESEKVGWQIPSKLQIIATISTHNNFNEFIDNLKQYGFIIEKEFGKLLLISKMAHGEKIYFYSFFDDRNNVPLFLTVARKTDDIPETLFDYIRRSKDISNLWITPKVMKELKDKLIDNYSNLMITYFSAKRTPTTDIPAEYRPEVVRGIQYRGDDGKQALDEMEFYYGVLPKIIEFRLPNGVAFKIDNKGIITLIQGDFSNVFEIIEYVVGNMIKLRNAIGGSSYRIHRVGINNQFSNVIQTPWSVLLPSGMKFGEIPILRKFMEGEEWEFTLLEDLILKDKMFFSARLIDNNNCSVFDIITTDNRVDIYPVEQINIGTYMRFYEFLVEIVDPLAVVG